MKWNETKWHDMKAAVQTPFRTPDPDCGKTNPAWLLEPHCKKNTVICAHPSLHRLPGSYFGLFPLHAASTSQTLLLAVSLTWWCEDSSWTFVRNREVYFVTRLLSNTTIYGKSQFLNCESSMNGLFSMFLIIHVLWSRYMVISWFSRQYRDV